MGAAGGSCLQEQLQPRLGITSLRRLLAARNEYWIGYQLRCVDQNLSTAPANILKIVAGLGVAELLDDPIDRASRLAHDTSAEDPGS